MRKIRPDFSEEITPNAPGTYLCKVVYAEVKVGRESGNEYINWKLETQPEERRVYYSTPIQGRGAGMFKHFIHCCGDKDYNGGEYDIDSVIGQMVSMELDVEEKTKPDGKTALYFKVVNVDAPTMEQLERLNKMTEEDIPF
jgi:hypothetical protein